MTLKEQKQKNLRLLKKKFAKSNTQVGKAYSHYLKNRKKPRGGNPNKRRTPYQRIKGTTLDDL